MPGSYPDPRTHANTAIQILEEAYAESQGTQTAPMILQALEALQRLKEQLGQTSDPAVDPYEFDESNLAF